MTRAVLPAHVSRSRRVLRVFAVADLVVGVLCIAAADRLSDRLGLANRSSVMVLGALLIALAIIGFSAASAPMPELPGRLRLQSWLNAGYALVLIGVIVVSGPSSAGAALFGGAAAAVAVLAYVEAKLAVNT